MIKRARWGCLCVLFACIAAGLFSRSQAASRFFFFAEYGGDTLYSCMIYALFAFLWPHKKAWILGLMTLAFSFAIEFSQLLSFPWLIALRATLARYILGQGFVASDLLCYCVGTLLAFGCDWFLLKKGDKEHE